MGHRALRLIRNPPDPNAVRFVRQTIHSRRASGTLTRASSQWSIRDGKVVEVGNDQPAFSDNGLDIWEPVTNSLLYSEDFTNAVWDKSQVSVTSNQGTIPGLGQVLDLIADNSTTAIHRVRQYFTSSSNVFAGGVFMKYSGGLEWVQLRVGSGGNTVRFDVDVKNKTANTPTTTGTGILYDYGIQLLDDDVIWASISGKDIDDGTGTYLYLAVANAPGAPAYSGTGQSVLLGGGVLSALSMMPPYIRTTSSTASLATNQYKLPISSSDLPSTGWTLLIEVVIHFSHTSKTPDSILLSSRNDANNYIHCSFGPAANDIIEFRKTVAGTNYNATATGLVTYSPGTRLRIALRWDPSAGTDIFVNGSKGTNQADTNAPVLGSTIDFHCFNGVCTSSAFSHRQFNTESHALTDSECLAWTGNV